jgi:hypothetical protein
MCGSKSNNTTPLEPHEGSVTFNSTPAKADRQTKRRATRQQPKRQSATVLTDSFYNAGG